MGINHYPAIYSSAFKTRFFKEAINMNPDQTALNEQSDLGPYYLQYRLLTREQTTSHGWQENG